MTAPLTDQQLAAIQGRHDRSSNSGAWRTTEQADAVADRGKLLAEVTRLRAELEQPREAGEPLRAAHFREAARLLEAADRDDDAVNLLDNIAAGIEQYNPNPGHQPHCVAATQGCCSCEEPTAPATAVCYCGHTKDQHQGPDDLGGAQCRVCPGDDERSWRHPYDPARPVHQTGCDTDQDN